MSDRRSLNEILESSLTSRGIEQWLAAPNRYLKGARPKDLLREGRDEEVREAATAFEDGVYL